MHLAGVLVGAFFLSSFVHFWEMRVRPRRHISQPIRPHHHDTIQGEAETDNENDSDSKTSSSKGFGKNVKGKKGGAKPPSASPAGAGAPAPAAVGSQGVGFGLGLDEYMKSGEGGQKAEAEEGEAPGAVEAA